VLEMSMETPSIGEMKNCDDRQRFRQINPRNWRQWRCNGTGRTA
jgi:hypothetical protein